MTVSLPDPWLRGPVSGISALLQPAAHAFVLAREDVDAAIAGVTAEQLWMQPGGITPLGFHLAHLAGSTGRLLTYARGEILSDLQRAALTRESTISAVRPPVEELLKDWHEAVAAALQQLASTSDASLTEPREIGRAKLPTTVLGCIFHAAEHAARHAGQVVTTAKLLRGLEPK
jgi:uncharacterized damage-inducible protein DinB